MTNNNPTEITPGLVIEQPYPFVLSSYEELDADGPHKRATWNPGVRHDALPPDDTECVADVGAIIFTVVSLTLRVQKLTTPKIAEMAARRFGHARSAATICIRLRMLANRHELTS